MKYDITPEDLQRAIAFANGENNGFHKDKACQELLFLCTAVSSAVCKANTALSRTIDSLNAKIERLDKKKNADIENGSAFVDFDGDIDLLTARVTVYILRDHNHPSLSKTKVVCLMYLMYAAWLATHNQRLFNDKPVRTDWGPQLWKVATFLDDKKNGLNGLREDYEKLCRVSNGGVATLLTRVVDKYGHMSAQALVNGLKDTAPYIKAEQGKRIKDSEIYYWQKLRITANRNN